MIDPSFPTVPDPRGRRCHRPRQTSSSRTRLFQRERHLDSHLHAHGDVVLLPGNELCLASRTMKRSRCRRALGSGQTEPEPRSRRYSSPAESLLQPFRVSHWARSTALSFSAGTAWPLPARPAPSAGRWTESV